MSHQILKRWTLSRSLIYIERRMLILVSPRSLCSVVIKVKLKLYTYVEVFTGTTVKDNTAQTFDTISSFHNHFLEYVKELN